MKFMHVAASPETAYQRKDRSGHPALQGKSAYVYTSSLLFLQVVKVDSVYFEKELIKQEKGKEHNIYEYRAFVE